VPRAWHAEATPRLGRSYKAAVRRPFDTALDSLETGVNEHYMLGELTAEQRRIFNWAIRKCREMSRTYRFDCEGL
jgi:hypothetical protein